MMSSELEYLCRNIYIARRSVLPPLPKNQNDVCDTLLNLQPKTNKAEDFLSVVDKENGVIVFSCYTNLHFLCSVSTIYIDGTFQFCTKFFHQLFTIHAFKNGYYIPAAFCLLSNKNSSSYLKLFQLLTVKCNTLELAFKPTTIVVDFEKAIHNACSLMWPHTKIVGCRFHLCQSWYRKIQNLGLVTEYKDKNSEIGNFLKLFFGLHFLEPHEVGDFFSEQMYADMPNDPRLMKFCDYIVENYIDEESNFPPSMWACTTDSMYRTTNACESFHSYFNSNFYNSHPSLFNFVNILINFQAQTYIKINSANCSAKKLKSVTKKKQNFIQAKIQDYRNNILSKHDFVKVMCFNYLPH